MRYTKPYPANRRRRIRHDEIAAWRTSVAMARELTALYSVDMASMALKQWGVKAWKPRAPRCVHVRRWAREDAQFEQAMAALR